MACTLSLSTRRMIGWCSIGVGRALAYTAFLDIALGFGSPAFRLSAGWHGVGSAILAGALIVLAATAVAGWLLYAKTTATRDESI